MRLHILILIGFFAVFSFWDSNAQTKTASKPILSNSFFKVISATTQRTLPGMRGADPSVTEMILIVWQTSKEPGSFFYKPASGGWITCELSRIHFYRNKKLGPGAPSYSTDDPGPGTIKKGDTAEVLLTPGGKYAIPASIPASLVNGLFFQFNAPQWYYVQVKKWTKLPDIAMP